MNFRRKEHLFISIEKPLVDAYFAERCSYFHGHGDYKIFDYYTAASEKKIHEDYWSGGDMKTRN